MKIWWRFLAKLGRRWAQDGRKMGQVGSKLRPRWAMMAPRSPSWAKFGSFWGGPGSIFGHLFRDLWKNGRSVKTTNTPSLLVVFWGLGPPLEGPGGCLGSVLGAMLEDVGSKMVFFWISWEMLWHLGAKMAHKSAKTRQDNHQMIFEVFFVEFTMCF